MFYPTELSTDEYLNDQVIWADFADHAEDIWSDEDESEWNILAEDAYLDSYWESLTEM